MRRYLLLLLLFLGTFFALVTPSTALVDNPLAVENTLLRAEYDLARKGQVYLMLNLANKNIEIRASGIIMATIPIQEIRPWGPLPEPGLHIVAEKDRVPEREKIKIPPPGGEEPAAQPLPTPAPTDPTAPPAVKKFEVQATEVTDMPANYSLWLEGGGLVTVKSLEPPTDWKSKLRTRFEKPLWKISHALESGLRHYHKQTYTELMLIMTPLDAQRLYWALPLGSAILIPAEG